MKIDYLLDPFDPWSLISEHGWLGLNRLFKVPTI